MAEVIGRPVDVEIVTRAHALLSASSADRWLVCTPSARIEEALPDRPSSYASDGTAAHALAELRLRYLNKDITKAEYLAGYEATKILHAEHIAEWTTSDWDAITSYVDYVVSETKRLDAKLIIEARVDYSMYAESGFGTSDALLVSTSQRTIKSIDLKFGKGVPVNAMNNSQAKLYALGGLIQHDPELFDTVEWTIHQPRLDTVSSDESTVDELIDWAENVVRPQAAKAWAGEGELVPSDKGCRFCKAAATCRARAAENVLIARRDFMDHMDADGKFDPEEFLLDMGELAKILPQLDQWMQWANAAKEFALKQVRDNEATIPGYKLVRGRANRKWGEPDEKIVDALKAAGVSETDIFVAPEPAVRSVAQMEKQLGKVPFSNVAKDLVITPPGTPALVPDSDPRESINKVAEAVKEFGVSN